MCFACVLAQKMHVLRKQHHEVYRLVQQTVMVKNKIGIHSRPAALLIDAADRFKSKITISNGERSASAASMTKILALRIKQDMEISISAEGVDEMEAVRTLVRLVESKFGEE